MKIASQLRSISVGTLVEVKWLDACFATELSDFEQEDLDRGGIIRFTVGFLAQKNQNGIVLVGELDKSRHPDRDFNLIPMGMVLYVHKIK